MLGAVERVGNAESVVVVDLVDQRRVDAVAVGVGGVRPVEADAVEDVAVAVQVAAERAAIADQQRAAFRHYGLAAAVGQHVLERRVKGEGQPVAQRETRLSANVGGIRRVDIDADEVGTRRCRAFILHGVEAGRRADTGRVVI